MSQTWNAKKYSQDATFVSQLASPLLALLAAKANERILDLGCGDGTLAVKLQNLGCQLVAVDSSQSMVEQALNKGITAYCQSGEALNYQAEFDAVFSNAALHWMLKPAAVVQGVYLALKPGGRFVAEMGGKGNILTIRHAINAVFQQHPEFGEYHSPWYFPSAEEYKELLVTAGFKVQSIELLKRPTKISAGIEQWLTIFAAHATEGLDNMQKRQFIEAVAAYLKPSLYSTQNGWIADYVRLRFIAYKPE
ncbi:class I SAM-dependent methyltransferase [Gayadomonas joobiniege]|uniref:class I SAM-dependent methyltransferase n=1 Tax=Gayadomonas joobiniege TaxID=1234606 RepID=UPI00036D445F|nr:class I SAM-dependent methyltransferase [Gayadomonas joobiniege]